MPQPRRLVGHPEPFQGTGPRGDRDQHLTDIIDVALGVRAAGNGQSHKFLVSREVGSIWLDLSEHDRTDLDSAYAAVEVEGAGKRLRRVLRGWDVREQGGGVEVDGVASGWPHDRDTGASRLVGQVGRGRRSVAKVLGVEGLDEAAGDGFEVVSGETSVSGEALREYEEIPAGLGESVVVHGEEPADVRHPVLLGGHGAPVHERENLAGDLRRAAIGLARFPGLDEPGVLREPAGIEEEGDLVFVTHPADLAEVGQ